MLIAGDARANNFLQSSRVGPVLLETQDQSLILLSLNAPKQILASEQIQGTATPIKALSTTAYRAAVLTAMTAIPVLMEMNASLTAAAIKCLSRAILSDSAA